jgi:integrase
MRKVAPFALLPHRVMEHQRRRAPGGSVYEEHMTRRLRTFADQFRLRSRKQIDGVPRQANYPVRFSAEYRKTPMSAHLKLIEPRNENRSVPIRPANSELRTREYLTPAEVEKLTKEARDGRYGRRDATLMLIAFRHGLRASEICDLEWSQVELGRSAALHVRRAKNGKPSVHPLRGDEIRALRQMRKDFPDSGLVFATERGGPFTPDAVNRLIKRIGERAGFDFMVHAHMLRHGCGYALANTGHDTRAIQDWLGHRSIQHTVRYTELAPTRFKDFWRD